MEGSLCGGDRTTGRWLSRGLHSAFGLALLFVLAVASAKGETVDGTLTINGLTRNYSIYLPTNYGTGESHPLMLALHPFNTLRWDAKVWRDTLIAFAEANGLILICPDGGPDGNVISEEIDTLLATALLDSAESWYSVDTRREYVMGFPSADVQPISTVWRTAVGSGDIFRSGRQSTGGPIFRPSWGMRGTRPSMSFTGPKTVGRHAFIPRWSCWRRTRSCCLLFPSPESVTQSTFRIAMLSSHEPTGGSIRSIHLRSLRLERIERTEHLSRFSSFRIRSVRTNRQLSPGRETIPSCRSGSPISSEELSPRLTPGTGRKPRFRFRR